MIACRKVVVILSVCLAAGSMSHAEDAGAWLGSTPREGTPFPDIPLPGLDGGQQTSISSFRGKKVLLLAFASW